VVRHERPPSARLLLAPGLIVSAGLVLAVGGVWGYVIGAVQLVLGVALFLRPRSQGAIIGATLSLVPAPWAAIRHWTAGLPGACRCARLPHPPPGLASVTGLAVLVQVALLGYAVWFTAAHRRLGVAPVEGSSERARGEAG
jgi:hypothetical protein